MSLKHFFKGKKWELHQYYLQKWGKNVSLSHFFQTAANHQAQSLQAVACWKKKRKEKETPQVPQNENKSKLLNPPETPRIQKEILCVKGGV